jgi:aryl-alcohol dehydrogenase-like predicted oxidoreductase
MTEARVSNSPRTVKFQDGTIVPAIGQGSWHLGEGRHPDAIEEEALRTGLSLGMTLIDTSEGYANGRSEELIGRAIAGQRDRVFLVRTCIVPLSRATWPGVRDVLLAGALSQRVVALARRAGYIDD